jgi:hypothetical protein
MTENRAGQRLLLLAQAKDQNFRFASLFRERLLGFGHLPGADGKLRLWQYGASS